MKCGGWAIAFLGLLAFTASVMADGKGDKRLEGATKCVEGDFAGATKVRFNGNFTNRGSESQIVFMAVAVEKDKEACKNMQSCLKIVSRSDLAYGYTWTNSTYVEDLDISKKYFVLFCKNSTLGIVDTHYEYFVTYSLAAWAIALIVVCGVLLLAGFVLVWCCRKRCCKKKESSSGVKTGPPAPPPMNAPRSVQPQPYMQPAPPMMMSQPQPGMMYGPPQPQPMYGAPAYPPQGMPQPYGAPQMMGPGYGAYGGR
jgi:hypothetical protein